MPTYYGIYLMKDVMKRLTKISATKSRLVLASCLFGMLAGIGHAEEFSTPAIDLGIVAQLSVSDTIYITHNDEQWGFFHY